MPTPSEIQSRLDSFGTGGTIITNVRDTTAAAPPAGGAGAAAGAWDTAANRDAAISAINNIRLDVDAIFTTLNNLLAELRRSNLISE